MADNSTLTSEPTATTALLPPGAPIDLSLVSDGGAPDQVPENVGVTFSAPDKAEQIPAPSMADRFTADNSAYWDGEDPLTPVIPDEAWFSHLQNLFSDPETLGGNWDPARIPFSYLMTPDDKASVASRQFIAAQMGVSAFGIADR